MIYAYDVATYDAVNGIGRVQVPGMAIRDANGYSLELFQRMEAVDADRPARTDRRARHRVDGRASRRSTSRSARSLGSACQWSPGLLDRPGPAGPIGVRGSLWSSAPGVPTSTEALVGDMYLDETNGDVYRFEATPRGLMWVRR